MATQTNAVRCWYYTVTRNSLTECVMFLQTYFVQLRIAKVKQTTTNGIDSTWFIVFSSKKPYPLSFRE